jgi:haloalkane dehalogenase
LSDKPDDSQYQYTLDRRVADLEKLLESLGITSNITLIVHDWGGMIGMTYAGRYPDRIKQLVVLNTSAFSLPTSKRLPPSLQLCRNTAIGALLVRGFNVFARGAAKYGVTRKPMDSKVREGYLRPYNSWRNRIATLRFVQDIPLSPGDRAYDTMVATGKSLDLLKDKPMLIAWGANDFVFDDHFLDEWKRRFPNAQVNYFENAGHYVLEDAGEKIIPLIEAFLTRETSP